MLNNFYKKINLLTLVIVHYINNSHIYKNMTCIIYIYNRKMLFFVCTIRKHFQREKKNTLLRNKQTILFVIPTCQGQILRISEVFHKSKSNLQSVFHDNQGYIEKPCLGTPPKSKTNSHNKSISVQFHKHLRSLSNPRIL